MAFWNHCRSEKCFERKRNRARFLGVRKVYKVGNRGSGDWALELEVAKREIKISASRQSRILSAFPLWDVVP